MTFSKCSIPLISLCLPALFRARFSVVANFLCITSLTKLLFPEPETPVTVVKTPTGIFTLTSFKLFSAAPIISMNRSSGLRRSGGSGMNFSPDKYFPVNDFDSLIICFGVPVATTSPPCSPARGPISMI